MTTYVITAGGLFDGPQRIHQTGVSGLALAVVNPWPVRINNVWSSGRHRITGTVKEDLTPTDLPLARKVWLFREIDGLILQEAWSSPITGSYSFEGIDPAYKYFVVAFDHEHNYRAVIADNLTPEPMP